MSKSYILTLSLLMAGATHIHAMDQAQFDDLMHNGTYQELKNAAKSITGQSPQKEQLNQRAAELLKGAATAALQPQTKQKAGAHRVQKAPVRPEDPLKFKGNKHVDGIPGTGRTGKGSKAASKALQKSRGGKGQ